MLHHFTFGVFLKKTREVSPPNFSGPTNPGVPIKDNFGGRQVATCSTGQDLLNNAARCCTSSSLDPKESGFWLQGTPKPPRLKHFLGTRWWMYGVSNRNQVKDGRISLRYDITWCQHETSIANGFFSSQSYCWWKKSCPTWDVNKPCK